MAHRSGFSRVVVVALTLLALPAAAAAADVTVAGPTPSGVTVVASMHGSRLCLEARAAPHGPARDLADGAISGSGCQPVPPLAPFGIGIDAWSSADLPAFDVRVGYVGMDVAAVELKRAGQVVARADTQPSPLPGAAGAVRFYALEKPANAAPDELAFLDAAGTVRRAINVGSEPDLPSPYTGGLPTTGTRTIARGRHGGVPWTLQTALQHPLASTPLEPERRVTLTCATVQWGTSGQRDGTRSCDATGNESEHVIPLLAEGCGPVGRVIGGIARSTVARLVVELADGTHRDVALHAAPDGGGARAGVLMLGAGVGVRALVSYDAGARVMERQPLRLQPLAYEPCRRGLATNGGVSILTYSAAGVGTVGPAPNRVAAVDSGDRLCLAINRMPRPPQGCDIPPVDEAEAHLEAMPGPSGRFVVGLVTPAIAAARLTLEDGSKRVVPAMPIPGYGGRYAQTTKVIAADVAGMRHVVRAELLDDHGRVLHDDWPGPEQPTLRRVATLGRVPGRRPLTLSRFTRVPGIPPLRSFCVAFGTPAADGHACLDVDTQGATLKVRCDERRIVVVSGLAHRTDTLSVRLAGGREIRARTFALPQVINGSTAAIAVAVVGPHDAPRTLVRRGRSPRRKAMVLPPAAEQCGYDGWVDPL